LDRFGSVFGESNIRTNELSIGSVWFGFWYFSKMNPNQTNRFGSVWFGYFNRFFLDVFYAIIFFSISLIPLIRYVNTTLLTLALSMVTQQTFLIHHSFKHISKFLPIVFACDPKSNLNSIFFIQHSPLINVMTSYNDVIHIL
jgi:hypothetical protein